LQLLYTHSSQFQFQSGAIKSELQVLNTAGITGFQFQVVRLKAAAVSGVIVVSK